MILPTRHRSPFAPPPSPFERQALPVASTAVASMIPLLPFVATVPILPPLGLIVLLTWRLLRADLWPLWAALPLGLWDDLYSGQPMGSAVCGWTAILLVLDAVDRRSSSRDYRQEWALAVAAIAGWLLFALVLARLTGSLASPLVLIPQLVLSASVYPLVVRACVGLDRYRVLAPPA